MSERVTNEKGLDFEEQKIEIEEYLSAHRRERSLLSGKDAQGRPVKYYRYMNVSSAVKLVKDQVHSQDSKHLFTEQHFQDKKEIIKKQLNKFLDNEKIEPFNSSDFENLDVFRNSLSTKLPKKVLFKYHNLVGGGFHSGLTGVISLSVGTPIVLPSKNIAVVEFAIPPEEIKTSFEENGWIGSENEKEVYTQTLDPNWVTNVFWSEKDLVVRLFADQQSPTYLHDMQLKEMAEKDDTIVYSHLSVLGEVLHKEKLKDLLPQEKLQKTN